MNLGLPDEVLFIAAGIVLVFAVFLFIRQHEKRREEAFRSAARQAGWSPVEPPLAVPDGATGFHLFDQGRSRRVTSAFTQHSLNFESTLLEYRYTTGSGKNSSVHRQTVLVLRRDGLALPAFELRPENVLHRIGKAFGYQDIDLENRPEFSKACLLRGADEAAIRRQFGDSGIVHHFERHRGWSVEAAGEWIVVYRHRKRAKPDQLRDFLREAERTGDVLAGR